MRQRERAFALGFVWLFAACSSEKNDDTSGPKKGEIGAQCLLPDESLTDFNGFALTEGYVGATLPDECKSELCVSNHFQGRASCPYGQTAERTASEPSCFVPRTNEPITVPVDPQLVARPPATTMTCTCQCAGPLLTEHPLCDCPNGTVCTNVYSPVVGGASMFCVVEGTLYDPTDPPLRDICDESSMNCGDPRPYPPP